MELVTIIFKIGPYSLVAGITLIFIGVTSIAAGFFLQYIEKHM